MASGSGNCRYHCFGSGFGFWIRIRIQEQEANMTKNKRKILVTHFHGLEEKINIKVFFN